MKALCLILDSDPIESWRKTYDSHRQFWHRCLDACPQIHGYFVRSDSTLSSETKLESRTFSVHSQECFGTVLRKLTFAIEKLLEDHEYVIQTGLSSMYDFRLLEKRPPSIGTYAGHLVDGCYVSGAGILMSSDVARMLVEDRDKADSEWQDVSIQRILHARGVEAKHEEMFVFDYSRGIEQLEEAHHLCYRLRDYADPDRAVERDVMRAVFEKLYGASA